MAEPVVVTPMRPVETRSGCVFRHVFQAILDRRVNQRTFAVTAVEHYHAQVPPELRTVRFVVDGDPHTAAKTNAKHIFRFAEDLVTRRLPADLEESLVLSLPEPYRGACLRDLCARYNLLPMEPVREDQNQDVRFLAQVAARAGAVLQTTAPIIADRVVDERDIPHIPAALDALAALASTVASLNARLLGVLNPRRER